MTVAILLRFLDDPGIEPTNNFVHDRALRCIGDSDSKGVSTLDCSKNDVGRWSDAFLRSPVFFWNWPAMVAVSRMVDGSRCGVYSQWR